MGAALKIISPSIKNVQSLDFSGVFRGKELTRKDRRLPANLPSINTLFTGGIPRGRISEIIGNQSSGRTSLAASFMASATQKGEVAGLVDFTYSFDPLTMSQAGIDLSKILWVHPADFKKTLRAAELILEAGGFGLLVVDWGFENRSLKQSSALRLARWAERSGSAVLFLGPHRMCGTFSALALRLNRNSCLFSRTGGRGPVLFDGLSIEAILARNKLGATGGRAQWHATIDTFPSCDTAEPGESPQAAGYQNTGYQN